MVNMKKKMILSIDVDHLPGSETGVHRILDLFYDLGIPGPFFITGRFAEDCPEVVREIDRKGHDVGCHGYSHGLDVGENFIDLPPGEQEKRIDKASGILGGIINRNVEIFRAPYAKIGSPAMRILESRGYRIDSSVASRRFDFGMGVSNSLGAFFAPSKPYHPSRTNVFRRGDSALLEVPISAFIMPLTLSALRTLGQKKVRIVFGMARRLFDPVVFYLHPWEVMEVDEIQLWKGYPKRHVKNRGTKAMRELELFIEHVRKYVHFIQFSDLIAENMEDS